jgi:hypothetical protein
LRGGKRMSTVAIPRDLRFDSFIALPSMARPAFARYKLLQYCEQQRQTITKHHPNQVKTNVAITVDETVAHACDFAPRNFRVRGLRGARHLTRGLADNLQ